MTSPEWIAHGAMIVGGLGMLYLGLSVMFSGAGKQIEPTPPGSVAEEIEQRSNIQRSTFNAQLSGRETDASAMRPYLGRILK